MDVCLLASLVLECHPMKWTIQVEKTMLVSQTFA
jgi:hypothetical protein